MKKQQTPQMLQNFFISFGSWMKYQYKNIRNQEGLTLAQFQALFIIEGFGLCNMSNLSEAIEVSKGTMTCMLNKLVEDGYVERSSSSKDRRNVYVSLTELGNKKVNQIKSKLLDAIDEKLNELEENKKEDIYKALEVLINTFQEKK
ncbi:MarR family winged helix-turn-helix transcriptional regulator [Clostridium formicaceticum]|uniref:Organic hydroperoxide resistance transcriptional regulator n=1 Tax=Clostridium formicaceticum TaxID=1497 RepID=A0AAC9RQL7_9CLOT|nr:MarR family transcriptional regulator [Clostridium formicaceticum]AOY75190.1 hypothetical protein BJL90_04285 [Clostridium formicaceticum]ARE89617.1 Organic hydroperoxide resistance transcriptional regulator [Clostridium formicaceticum]